MPEEVKVETLTVDVIAQAVVNKLNSTPKAIEGPNFSDQEQRLQCLSWLGEQLSRVQYYGNNNIYIEKYRSKVMSLVKEGLIELL